MSVEPTAPTAPTAADQTTSDPAPLVPTDTPVTTREIAEFLRHLTDLRVSGRDADPDARAAFGHRKTELFTRLAADPSTPASPPAAERHTP